jgi:hypothetical protein
MTRNDPTIQEAYDGAVDVILEDETRRRALMAATQVQGMVGAVHSIQGGDRLMAYYIDPKTPDQRATSIARDTDTWTTPAHRCAHCPYCTHLARVHRRGNALAAAAKVRGLLADHLRTRHNDMLVEER